MKDHSNNPREAPLQPELPAVSRPPIQPGSQHRVISRMHPTSPELRPPPSKIIAWFVLKLADRTLYYGSIGALLFGIVSACYLTLRPSSDINTITWLPRSIDPIIQWADDHGRLRNVPAYALLAMPVMVLCRTRRSRTIAIILLAVFGTVLEALQVFIPTRFCEWQDAALSWLGLLITWGLAESLYWGVGRRKSVGKG